MKYPKTYATVINKDDFIIIVKTDKDKTIKLELRWRNGKGSTTNDFKPGCRIKIYQRPELWHLNFRKVGS